MSEWKTERFGTAGEWRTNRRTRQRYRNPPVGTLGHERYFCKLCGEGIVQGTEYSLGPHDERNLPTGPQISPVCSRCYEAHKSHENFECPICGEFVSDTPEKISETVSSHLNAHGFMTRPHRPTSGKGFYGV